MAKRTAKVKGCETPKLATIAALERAISQLKATLTDKKARLGEGAYRVCVDVHVEGDVTVAARVEGGEPVETRTFNERALLAAMFLGIDPAERRRAIGNALKCIVRGGKGGATIEDAAAHLDEIADECARREGLMELRKPAGRAGAIGGKPGVLVSGTVGEAGVEFEVDGDK